MDSGRWRAPAAQGPVRATLRLPGSKSISNRALILAALSDSPSVVSGIEVLNVATVGKTFPDFTTRWEELVRGDDS